MQGKHLYTLIWNAAAPAKVAWYFNNIRARRSLPRRQLSLLPTGTTSNESLHREINRWFDNVKAMHLATLRLKLRVLSLMKLLTHNAALYAPTLRQCRPQTVLVRTTARPLFEVPAWARFCRELTQEGLVRKATLPLAADRARMTDAVRKRPAAQEQKGAQKKRMKRTPFSLKRVGAPYKRPSSRAA